MCGLEKKGELGNRWEEHMERIKKKEGMRRDPTWKKMNKQRINAGQKMNLFGHFAGWLKAECMFWFFWLQFVLITFHLMSGAPRIQGVPGELSVREDRRSRDVVCFSTLTIDYCHWLLVWPEESHLTSLDLFPVLKHGNENLCSLWMLRLEIERSFEII